MKENAREIRKIEKLNQESARNSTRSTGSVRTMNSDRYEHVESKVAQELKVRKPEINLCTILNG